MSNERSPDWDSTDEDIRWLKRTVAENDRAVGKDLRILNAKLEQALHDLASLRGEARAAASASRIATSACNTLRRRVQELEQRLSETPD